MSVTEYLRLGVNIDHVATVRNARGAGYPDPVRAAFLAAVSFSCRSTANPLRAAASGAGTFMAS